MSDYAWRWLVACGVTILPCGAVPAVTRITQIGADYGSIRSWSQTRGKSMVMTTTTPAPQQTTLE
ncbi:hypothetical protein RY27_15520 [Litorilinea aerophila]|nr:hypothetical protein RY27_15520 [Litorilinea aerophila]